MSEQGDAATVSEAYGRFSAPIAVVMAALSFMPIFEDVVVREDGVVRTSRHGFRYRWRRGRRRVTGRYR